jgi:UDP-N-acetylmuramoyl-tripeptide--D-alanyl-D-alanine ligase
MRKFQAKEFEKIEGVKKIIGNPDALFEGVSYDSRKMEKGNLFVAVKGEKVDGNDFVEKAFESGATVAISSREVKPQDGKSLILSEFPEKSVQEFSKSLRKKYEGSVIGVVGSVGKTTTKEFAREFLKTSFKTYSNEGNKNNLLGLPETIINGDFESKYWILEMGISRKGEMDELASIAMPDSVIFTSIKPVHLEFLDDLKTIYDEKKRVLNHLLRPSFAIFNNDDSYLKKIPEEFDLKFYSFGTSDDSDLKFKIIENKEKGILAQFDYKKDSIQIELPFLNRSYLYNFASALLLHLIVGGDIEKARDVAKNIKLPSHRGIIYELQNGVTLYDDSYNSNPEAVKSLLASLKDIKRKKIGVFGEMKELGTESSKYHSEIGEFAQSIFSSLLCVGDEPAKEMAEIFGRKNKDVLWVKKFEDGIDFIKTKLERNSFLVVKGSRSIGLDKFVDYLLKEIGKQ